MNRTSNLLKAALFATGLAGIVSEYTLSTLATYFLGDSVFQWTMIVSIMLFSMGLGSRISKSIEHRLLEKFVWIEFSLSIIASNVTVIVYTIFAFYGETAFIIYLLSILIGLLIGMEIPLVVRLNEGYQSLRVNISSALENDYYGSLAGGAFFAFVGLPILGLTYTPLILGTVNFSVALLFIGVIWKEVNHIQKKKLTIYASLTLLLLSTTGIFSQRIVQWGDHIRYQDKVVYSEQTPYQKIVLTYSNGNYWLFLNGHQQLSSIDEVLYHEPLVHPPMQLHENPKHILVLGGGDGAAVREILKYAIDQVTLVDLDPSMTKLAQVHPVLLGINEDALNHPKVRIINQDGFTYLEKTENQYDVIIADFPDPRTVDLGRLYTQEFYWLCRQALKKNGLIITQAGSPYYAQQAFECINITMEAAGFKTLPIHNQVPSLGEWGWVIGAKNVNQDLVMGMNSSNLVNIKTKWLTNEAMVALHSFGKEVLPKTYRKTAVNRLHEPVLYKYYLNGRWDLY
ncbi:MAG: polyamine aminopropyltransferase [Bacteroidota bacterium]